MDLFGTYLEFIECRNWYEFYGDLWTYLGLIWNLLNVGTGTNSTGIYGLILDL